MYQRTKAILDWLIVLAIYAITLLAVPISDKLFSRLNANTANPILNSIINVVITAAFIGFVVFLILKGSKPVLPSCIWLAFLFIISICFLMKVELTKDRLHFLGYGILSLFLYRAMRHNIGTKMLYVWNCLIIMLFAILDEVLQLSGTGGRYFEFKDIGIDWLSGLAGQATIALVIKPKLEAVDIKIRGYLKGLKKMKALEKVHRPSLQRLDLDRLAEQICLAFKNTASQNGGHVHFIYRGKKDHLVLVCCEKRLGQIIAKDRNCKEGEYIPWDKSEFSHFSPEEAFLEYLPKISAIVIDYPSIQKSWDSFDKFQGWLDKTTVWVDAD